MRFLAFYATCLGTVVAACATQLPAASTVAQWIRDDRFRIEGPGSVEVTMLLIPEGASFTEASRLTECGRATTILPAPQGLEEVFATVDGQLHRYVGGAGFLPMIPDAGVQPPSLVSLLGFEAHASPLQVIARSNPDGLWAITVEEDRITNVNTKTLSSRISANRFLERHPTGRCFDGDEDCLVVRQHGSETYIDLDPHFGEPHHGFLTLADQGSILDVAWAGRDGRDVVVLAEKPCRASVGANTVEPVTEAP